MSRLFYHIAQDNAGNLLFDVTGTMRIAGSGTLATIYGDEALTVILPNPMTNHPSFASFKCFLGPGYYDFYLAKSGYTFETLTGVQGHGTMAQQDASAVAITGGQITLPAAATTGGLAVTDVAGSSIIAVRAFVTAGTDKYNLFCGGTAPNYFEGGLGIRTLPLATADIVLGVPNGIYGLASFPTNQANAAVFDFRNQSLVSVGLISTTATTTSYGTTSDARLKEAVQPLAGALDVVRALRPVSFVWKADGSPGRGFIAQDVQALVPEAVTGEPEAVEADGTIRPMGMDLSKLVPYLIGAVKELTQQVETLTARLEAAGA